MSWTADMALAWTERAISLALLLQTIELLQIRRVYADDGVWRWADLAPEHVHLPAPLRWLFAALLPYRAFIGLLVVRLACVALLLTLRLPAALPILLLSQVAICVRFRGTFNGGSDYMTVLVLLGTTLTSLAGSGPVAPLFTTAALAYIAVQTTLSYFIAGIAKLRQRDWRSGVALLGFVTSDQFGAPRWSQQLLGTPARARILSWGVIAFECLFPLAWLGPTVCLPVLALGLCFHLANAIVFGLNRFLFAWAAAYPAMLYMSAR